jgi:hypothetical protein
LIPIQAWISSLTRPEFDAAKISIGAAAELKGGRTQRGAERHNRDIPGADTPIRHGAGARLLCLRPDEDLAVPASVTEGAPCVRAIRITGRMTTVAEMSAACVGTSRNLRRNCRNVTTAPITPSCPA